MALRPSSRLRNFSRRSLLAQNQYRNLPCYSLSGMFKKVRPARPQALWRVERTIVRVHDKGPRTPLAAFFNIPLGVQEAIGQVWRWLPTVFFFP